MQGVSFDQANTWEGYTLTDCYTTLRNIGVSVETADALAPVLLELTERKREAFYLWASGMSGRAVARELGFDEKEIRRMLAFVRKRA